MEIARETSEAVAVSFTRHLVDRAYEEAYALTSNDHRASKTLDGMIEAFEMIVPPDWGDAEPIEVVHTMDSWPGKTGSDLLWVYVSIGGDVYSEALTAVITEEDGRPRIREVVFGRP